MLLSLEIIVVEMADVEMKDVVFVRVERIPIIGKEN